MPLSKALAAKELELSNRDFFNITALEIFHRCSNDFPMEASFTAVEVAELVKGYFNVEQMDNKKLEDIVWETSSWLVSEGFLRDVASNDQYMSVVLTQKGLNATNSVPSVISGKKSFNEVFVTGLSNLSHSVAAGLMVEFFKNGS